MLLAELGMCGRMALRTGNSEFDAQVQELQDQEDALNKKLHAAPREVDTLGRKLSALDKQRFQYINAKELAQDIQELALGLRREAQDVLEDLRAARMSLMATRGKIKAIAAQLQECGYAESRRDIATKLRDTLSITEGVGRRRNMTLGQADVEKAMGVLLNIDGNTPRVVQLLTEIST